MNINYRRTRIASYMSYFVQAAVITLIPLLYIPIKDDLGLSYVQLATLLSINFTTQLIVDLVLSRAADKYGYKPFVLLSNVVIFFGFILFALSPSIFKNPYIGFVISTILCSIGGGLEEILISPLINEIPSPSKSGSMAFLHSAYGFGQMFCIALTTLFVFLAGGENWRIIVALWAIAPLIVFFIYLNAPYPEKKGAAVASSSKIGKTIFSRGFILCVLIIFFGAGTENTMVQWSSAYMEKALSLPKLLGDGLGIFMFAAMLTLCRVIFGIAGDRINLAKSMLWCSFCAIFCYVAVATTSAPAIGLIACALTGFFSAMLWPGTLVLADKAFPQAGAWMFAFLAFGGDFGAAFCPWLSGFLSDNAEKIPLLAEIGKQAGLNAEQLGLRSGMGISVLFPVLTALLIALYIRFVRKSNSDKPKEN